MSATVVRRRQKILRLHWLECPKTVAKNKIWTRKQVIENLIFGVYLLIPGLLVESRKANKNYQKISLILRSLFYEPQLTQHYEK